MEGLQGHAVITLATLEQVWDIAYENEAKVTEARTER